MGITAGAEDAKPRVLSVVTLLSRSGRYGGPADTARRQCRLLSEIGYETCVLGGALSGDELIERGTRAVHVRRWLPLPGFAGLFSLNILHALWRHSGRSDVVRVSFAREAVPVVAAVIAKLQRKRLVLQPHGMLTARTSLAHRALDLVLRPLYSRADAVIALTEREKSALQHWAGAGGRGPTITVIGNPSQAHPVKASPLPPERPVALFAARLEERKRVTDFVEAARISHARGARIEYHVAGPDQGDLELVVRKEREVPPLRYLGALHPDELSSLLPTVSAFVLPSRDEPWGNVLVSAIMQRVPVVVCASAALSTEVTRLGVGLVVSDQDPGAIAAAVERLVAEGTPNRAPDAVIERAFGDAVITERLAAVVSPG